MATEPDNQDPRAQSLEGPARGGGAAASATRPGRTPYGYDMRVVVCPQCTAPVEAPRHGGVVACRACHATSQITPRDESIDQAIQRTAPPMSEAQRFEKLRQQDGRPLMPPPSLQGFVSGGGLPEI